MRTVDLFFLKQVLETSFDCVDKEVKYTDDGKLISVEFYDSEGDTIIKIRPAKMPSQEFLIKVLHSLIEKARQESFTSGMDHIKRIHNKLME